MDVITTDDAQLRFEHTPRPGAPALLLLNALGTSLEMWDAQAEAFSERYELVRYDARGHGKSALGPKLELTIETLARDALAVLDACGIARAHLCGLSLGGMTAMYLAANWPDRALKIALCNTSPYMPPRDLWQSRIDTVSKQGMQPLIDGILGRWFTPEFRTAEPQQVEQVRAMLLATDPRGYAACAAAIRDMDQRESIKSIASKTLVIYGSRDPGAGLAHAELIVNGIADSTLVPLEAAHLSNIERSSEFNTAILDFLAA
jgi:3-oxoadipate enol-lactonase